MWFYHNMKTIKFREALSKLILAGKKNITWRLFDDKNLSAEEVVSFLIWETQKEFSKAKLINVKETTFGKLTAEDREGHENFSSNEEMYETYSKYYNRKVDENTSVKVIRFELN